MLTQSAEEKDDRLQKGSSQYPLPFFRESEKEQEGRLQDLLPTLAENCETIHLVPIRLLSLRAVGKNDGNRSFFWLPPHFFRTL
jgi:hypothetical protein